MDYFEAVERATRPLRRRRKIVLRPVLDLLRARNPWVLARFLFFGWYVWDMNVR
jgi:hypothetical protein